MQDSTSRRAFLATGLAAAAAQAQNERRQPTAGEIIELIKANVGVPWAEKTVDGIIVGSPDTPVRGIATTVMATYDVVRRASAAGRNLVITHEPTFYSHRDEVDQLLEDAIYKEKLAFLEDHQMVVFHFHDHWHRRHPDGIAVGMMRELGWEEYVDSDDVRRFELPPTTLHALAQQMQSKLKASTLRVVGDPSLEVRRVRASWGYTSQFPAIPALADPDADVFVCGETREWEAVEYAEDLIASGRKKGLIVAGHVASEQAGMKYCAEWLRTFLPETPVELVATREPFWSPGAA